MKRCRWCSDPIVHTVGFCDEHCRKLFYIYKSPGPRSVPSGHTMINSAGRYIGREITRAPIEDNFRNT